MSEQQAMTMPDGEKLIIEIDIATRIVGDNEDMYVVRPGASFSLYDDFQREDAVFLDFPDLPFALDQKPNSTVLVREIVTRSIAIRDGHLGKLENPSREQADYTGQSTNRRVNAYIGAIQRLYYELPVGTIIIIPGKTYIDDVAFAEITGPTERRKAAKAYPDENMLVRPVRWLAKKQKASLTPELRAVLGQPTPVMLVPRDLRAEILKIAFKQYIFKGLNSTRIMTSTKDFSIVDDLNIQLFNNYVAGLLAAREAEVPDTETLGISSALGYLKDRRDLVPELDQSISSPGFQRLYGNHIAPLVIGALMTAALSIPATTLTAMMTVALASPATAQTAEIRVKNSAMLKNDPCAVDVQQRVNGSMRIAHFDEFLEMCAALKRTKEDTGLSTSMKAKERTVKSRTRVK
jgi:hypothetical protein